ncbi:MAG: bifunctional phosphopantothenoylcysteine decarboxylase/phosphopantothenate--cysteine ligase CoaBC [Ferruginibacter sp.]|nr:bifunctional phosphopantothenoylcysteine decarboxylase/phosphopantothenate--cysteine ligase CoaBC [Ferruginibacter sp.]
MLKQKKILLAVSGSIAAYKAATLIRLYVKEGAEVKVIMTNAAENFIPALTLATLSKNKVFVNLFEGDTWSNHVMLGRWADFMLVAPASCNTIAKMANGICDNLLQAVYLSATCPIFVAPAMDEDMWVHAATQRNILKLNEYGNIIIPVNSGELASGLIGQGRMAEPEDIVKMTKDFFKIKDDLLNKKILISAGPTYEQIDPVRFIGNNSTGKMGIALANECVKRGALVTLVLGPTTEITPNNVNIIRVKSAEEMLNACILNFNEIDIAIMSAAVADYTPNTVATHKIKKKEDFFSIELKKTEDILKHLGGIKTSEQTLVGFALETQNEEENALKKLKNKNADFIVLNSLQDAGAGFGHNTNKITIFGKDGSINYFDLKTKEKIATDIINTILKK